MRKLGLTAALALCFMAPAAAMATAPAASAQHYTSADTEIGTLLDDPAARAILEKHIPGFTTKDQIEMARSMTLRTVQQFAPDILSDGVLAQVDADLAKLPPK